MSDRFDALMNSAARSAARLNSRQNHGMAKVQYDPLWPHTCSRCGVEFENLEEFMDIDKHESEH